MAGVRSGPGQLANLLIDGQGAGSGGKNVVSVVNRVDGRLSVRANVELNRIEGSVVASSNLALAYGSCIDCQTFGVALQINLYRSGASNVHPQNYALAANVDCTRCYTVARAVQYGIPADDPKDPPQEVRDLMDLLDRELLAIQSESDVSLSEAEARINAVVVQFIPLAEHRDDLRDEARGTTNPDGRRAPG